MYFWLQKFPFISRDPGLNNLRELPLVIYGFCCKDFRTISITDKKAEGGRRKGRREGRREEKEKKKQRKTCEDNGTYGYLKV